MGSGDKASLSEDTVLISRNKGGLQRGPSNNKPTGYVLFY